MLGDTNIYSVYYVVSYNILVCCVSYHSLISFIWPWGLLCYTFRFDFWTDYKTVFWSWVVYGWGISDFLIGWLIYGFLIGGSVDGWVNGLLGYWSVFWSWVGFLSWLVDGFLDYDGSVDGWLGYWGISDFLGYGWVNGRGVYYFLVDDWSGFCGVIGLLGYGWLGLCWAGFCWGICFWWGIDGCLGYWSVCLVIDWSVSWGISDLVGYDWSIDFCWLIDGVCGVESISGIVIWVNLPWLTINE